MRQRGSLKRFLRTVLVVLGCLTPFGSTAQAQDSATVSGCITDPVGYPLPGVTVDVVGGGRHRVVHSGASGCRAVADVPAGSYFVFATLPGFVSMTYDDLNVEPGRSQGVDLRMRIAPICECILLPATLSELWDDADARGSFDLSHPAGLMS